VSTLSTGDAPIILAERSGSFCSWVSNVNEHGEVKTSGFGGTVTNTSLPDVIQLICISRNTCRMAVRSGLKAGTVFVRDGEIVHAETANLKGEEAFYDIMSWELGVFSCDAVPVEAQTIHESWDFLLIESMRRLETVTIS
jgi:hypothetical protein